MMKMQSQIRQLMSSQKGTAKRFKKLPTVRLSFMERLGEIPLFLGKLKFECDRSHYHRHLYAKYGNIVREERYHEHTAYLFDSNDWRNLHRQEDEKPYRKIWDPLEFYRDRAPKSADLPKSCLFSDNGEDWYRLRSVANNFILKPEAVEVYIPNIDRVAVKFVNSIPRLLSKDGEMDFLHNELTLWSLQTQFFVLFHHFLGEFGKANRGLGNDETTELMICMREFYESLLKLEINIPWYAIFDTKLFKKMGKSYELMTSIIHKSLNATFEQWEKEDPDQIGNINPSLMYRLFQSNVDVTDIFSIVCNLVIGGVKPMGTAMAVLLYHLSKDAEIHDQVYEEVGRIGAINPAVKLDADKIQNALYIKACFKEALRIAPVVDETSRVLKQDLETSEYRVPAGTRVVLPHQGVSNFWFTEPDKFDPRRWLRPKGDDEAFMPFNEWLSFGVGPRACVGKMLAETECCVLLIRIMQKYSLSNKTDYGFRMSSGIINEPNSILNVKFEPPYIP